MLKPYALMVICSHPPFPLPHIAYHHPEVVARHGEHLVADALLHATLKGMEGDSGVRVAEALLQYIQYAAHLKNGKSPLERNY